MAVDDQLHRTNSGGESLGVLNMITPVRLRQAEANS
jgi:hypothetical protein